MKKNKQNATQRKAAAKRATKRADRLRKTKKEKHIRKAKVTAEKKAKERKFKEHLDKLLQARFSGM